MQSVSCWSSRLVAAFIDRQQRHDSGTQTPRQQHAASLSAARPRLPTIRAGGEARLWSGCDNTPRIYISALFGDDETSIYVLGRVTTRQEAAAIAETLMSLEIDGTPLA